MKNIAARCILSMAVIVCISSGFSGTEANSWNIGQVVSSGVSGQGPNTQDKSKATIRRDIWWNYCVASEGTAYSVASRLTPAKSGLINDHSIKFRISRNQMYILHPTGKRIELRILRKDKGAVCP
jgi:hypothetical protein